MYSNPYINNYNSQISIDRINTQIAELEKMKNQLQTNSMQQNQPSINQTFQLAPTNQNSIKYANSIEEVQKDIVIGDTPYFSNDMSVVWIKNTKGEIKSYELNEIVRKDKKDMIIENLQYQLQELRKEFEDAKSNNKYVDESVKSEKSSNVSSDRTSTKKSK